MDPQLSDDDFSAPVIRDLYEGLTGEDWRGNIIAAASDSWTVDATQTVYKFHIRPDARWSNGDRLTPDEFVAGLRRAVDPATASGAADLLAAIKGATEVVAGRKPMSEFAVTAVGADTLQIQLDHPAPFILQILALPVAAPFHLGTRERDPANRQVVYNGAYLLSERVPGSFIELRKNPFYWNSANVSISRVRYLDVESEETELNEYLAGQLDMTYTIPLPNLASLKRERPSEVQVTSSLSTTYLALNLSRPPLGNSAKLRQALSMAIDRDQISTYLLDGVKSAYSLVAEGISGYDPPSYEWSRWSRDRQLAYSKLLFAEAGYSISHPLKLRIYFNDSELIKRTMIAVAESWRHNLGVQSELIGEEFRVFLSGRKDHDRWDVARFKWDADYSDPSSFLDVFTTTSAQNDSGYSSDSFDHLVSEAKQEANSARRVTLYQNAEHALLEDYPIVPLYFPQARRLVKPYIGGAELHAMNRTYTKNLFWK